MLPGTAQPRGQGPDVAETDTAPGTGKVAGDTAATAFISKWQGVTASELSTSQSFLIDLCHLLGVDTPHPTAGWHPDPLGRHELRSTQSRCSPCSPSGRRAA